ncbi:MAG: histidinol dehydrogenase [Bacteroidota bacterium]|nr:histidinol dehydrogenase [Bacteroidota bacterium]MDP4190427.1 histidinol dehydrogenase [Bacteroidota bacterium]MDP4194566.1 histidinol dehydrogenase [Bacteroidota bacterium]
MKIFNLKDLNSAERDILLLRPAIKIENTFEIVRPILEDVKKNGLSAALTYAKKFDNFSGGAIAVSKEEFQEAEKNLDPNVKKAIQLAAKNIEEFHKLQKSSGYEIETTEGVKCLREFRAIESVGLYVPGGSAVLPSTMLMLSIPAKIAGCKRIVVCSPAKEDGKINDALLYAASFIGVDEFYKLGGAQAVALMAYGDKEIKKVSKIFGPGNQFVTAAKLLVSIDLSGCAIDMPAGPSEVLVIADEKSDPSFVAADLLSQAEHGGDSQVVLLSTSKHLVDLVSSELEIQISKLPRKDMAKKALESSFALIAGNLSEAFDFSNDYAPEHLILHLEGAESYKDNVINAGSVFLGQFSPESVGDYASGTNHSLPTYGYARSFGGVTVESFMRSITFQCLTKQGLINIASTVETLAEAESLFAHKNAVSIRINK